jgi:hypothetical protein
MLNINYASHHEDVWGSEGISVLFLISVLHGGELSALRSGHIISAERAPGSRRIGGRMGTRTGLDAMENRIS